MNVLLVEDDAIDVEQLQRAVAPLVIADRLNVLHVRSLDAGVQRLRAEATRKHDSDDERLDVVMSNLYLPGVGLGQEVSSVRRLYEACLLAGVPLVLFCGHDIDAVSRMAFVDAGVERVLHKGADLGAFGQDVYSALIEVTGSNTRRKQEGIGPLQQLQRAILSEVACLHHGQQNVHERLQVVALTFERTIEAAEAANATPTALQQVWERLRKADPRALLQLVVLALWLGMVLARSFGLWTGEVPTFAELQQRLGTTPPGVPP